MTGFPKASHIQTTMDDNSHLDMSNCYRTSRDSTTVMSGYWRVNWEKSHAPTFNISHVIPHRFHMWPDLPKPATYAHNSKECFSSPIDSSINKLTNSHNTTATSWLVCFIWGLFSRPVWHPRVLGCSLNATGWLVQAIVLPKITNWIIHDIGYGFSYILWHCDCNGASF